MMPAKGAYKERRKALIETIKQMHPQTKRGLIVIWAAFERDGYAFRQDSSFYYLTGSNEPGIALTIDMNGEAVVYVPRYRDSRAQWVISGVECTPACAQTLGVDRIEYLGDEVKGYSISEFFTRDHYRHLIERLTAEMAQTSEIFTLLNISVIDRLSTMIPDFACAVRDVSLALGKLRRKKSRLEIELLYKAVEMTMIAQHAAARALEAGVNERALHAGIQYVFTENGAREAFPSIIAGGKMSTVLHYTEHAQTLKQGDVVVVDIGAQIEGYCGDLTRTYPISGEFTKRQRQVYQIVLDTQEYIASCARPGMWLRNAEKPEQSLHHLAVNFLKNKGYAQYFPHSIGHFLGLDVHDVGDYNEPLQEGDVITIEPGIYIPQEGLGIRIEDNYWVVRDGVECLSSELPKDADAVEEMVQQGFDECDDEDCDDDMC